MAVATPVLERKVSTDNSGFTRENIFNSLMTADEQHNSRISENYSKLINPDSKPKDIISDRAAVQQIHNIVPVEVPAQASLQEVQVQKPYLVENARADAEIFRADSPINLMRTQAVSTAVVSMDEEENEDLRPTQTTIQYKSSGIKKTEEEGKIHTYSVAKKSGLTKLTKKDRIIIAVAFTVIIALFVLIIVNSAVISNLNRDVAGLQTALSTAESSYDDTVAEKTAYLEHSNLFQVVSEFAEENGMTLR